LIQVTAQFLSALAVSCGNALMSISEVESCYVQLLAVSKYGTVCKLNKYVMNDGVPQRGLITATDRTLSFSAVVCEMRRSDYCGDQEKAVA